MVFMEFWTGESGYTQKRLPFSTRVLNITRLTISNAALHALATCHVGYFREVEHKMIFYIEGKILIVFPSRFDSEKVFVVLCPLQT